MAKRNLLPAPDLKDLQALADWLCNVAFLAKQNDGQAPLQIPHTSNTGQNLSDHAANIRRAIARLKQKDDATAQPQDWGKDDL